MSIRGKYVLVAKSGRVIRESPVPTNLMFDFGQELTFVSGDIFTDKPMPAPVVHLHHDNFDVKFFCKDVSEGSTKKYCHNFIVTSVPEATPELVEAIEHFLFGAADFVNEKVAVRDQYYRFFLPLIRAREETKKEEEAKAEASELRSFLDFVYDLLSEADYDPRKLEDPMESMFSGFGGRGNPMRDLFSFGERHEPIGRIFHPGFCGIGIEGKNPFFDMIPHFPNLHRDPTEKKEASSTEETSPDHVDGTVPVTDDSDCHEDGELDHPEETATEDSTTDHSEDTTPDGDAGESSGLSSSERGTH